MASLQLTPSQSQALFDILTHHEAYAEIRALRNPATIATFGAPLEPENTTSSSPLVQTLLQRFLLVLPGLRDVSSDFWTRDVKGLATALDDANLSESYDKGSIGIRRTLSTAIAAMVEYVSRGALGGYPKTSVNKDRQYDLDNPDDVVAAWDDFLQQIIYGDLLDRMFKKAAETDKLSDHELVVQAGVKYALVICGSFLHYILIISPRGQSILPLLTRAHNMAPYFLIRQTLKVGNAASMLSGMVKLVLAKLNMSTVTTWFGGQGSDSGMNLLQQIISSVLSSDTSELKKRAAAIEKDKESPNKDVLEMLKAYGTKQPEEQGKNRTESEMLPESIVNAVLSESSEPKELSHTQHELALEYIAIQLAIRDREQLINVLCNHQPDLFTSSIRTLVSAYEPIIRALHQAVDLSAGVSDAEAFLTDLIKISQVENKNGTSKSPSVEDYCRLLDKHQPSSHRFIHQVLKNGKELSNWYREYAEHAAKQYQQENSQPRVDEHPTNTAAGDFAPQLESLFAALSDDDKSKVLKEADQHAEYLSSLTQTSTTRMTTIIRQLSEPESNTMLGPGMFLSRWQALMDEALITPAKPEGPVRYGRDASVKDATRVDTDGSKKGAGGLQERVGDEMVEPPDVRNSVRLLSEGFRESLRGMQTK